LLFALSPSLTLVESLLGGPVPATTGSVPEAPAATVRMRTGIKAPSLRNIGLLLVVTLGPGLLAVAVLVLALLLKARLWGPH
jgi:hypothetical protein